MQDTGVSKARDLQSNTARDDPMYSEAAPYSLAPTYVNVKR